jgi:hypothetical protein
MTRIASKFGIAAALTLGMFATAAAQTRPTGRRTTPPTTKVEVSKGETTPAPVQVRVDTVYQYRRDTVTLYRRDTVTVTGPTVMRYDTVTVMNTPGWLNRGNGMYFGLGAGPYYPSGGLGAGQIPGYAFQMNLGVDPAGSPLGIRLTGQLARPDESQPFSTNRARPTVMNGTLDLKLRLPFLSSMRFPNFGLYAVGGGAYSRYQDVVLDDESHNGVLLKGYHDNWGWDAGGGATLSLGHARELFLEARVINFSKSGFENAHQLPIILGINWY